MDGDFEVIMAAGSNNQWYDKKINIYEMRSYKLNSSKFILAAKCNLTINQFDVTWTLIDN